MRKDFILSKYMEWQFAQRSGGSPETKRKYLQDAVRSRDVFILLQLYAERMDFSLPLPCPLQVSKHVFTLKKMLGYKQSSTGWNMDEPSN